LQEFEEKHQRPTEIKFIKDVIDAHVEQKGSRLASFDFFSDSELALLTLKFTCEKKEYQIALRNLPDEERRHLLWLYRYVFISRHGKEKEKELFSPFLTDYYNNGYGLSRN
jgi:hypothetical protein